MQIALNSRNKFVIVNESYENLMKSHHFDNSVITWKLNSVAEEISDRLNYVTIASKVWTELHERLSEVNGHKFSGSKRYP